MTEFSDDDAFRTECTICETPIFWQADGHRMPAGIPGFAHAISFQPNPHEPVPLVAHPELPGPITDVVLVQSEPWDEPWGIYVTFTLEDQGVPAPAQIIAGVDGVNYGFGPVSSIGPGNPGWDLAPGDHEFVMWAFTDAGEGPHTTLPFTTVEATAPPAPDVTVDPQQALWLDNNNFRIPAVFVLPEVTIPLVVVKLFYDDTFLASLPINSPEWRDNPVWNYKTFFPAGAHEFAYSYVNAANRESDRSEPIPITVLDRDALQPGVAHNVVVEVTSNVPPFAIHVTFDIDTGAMLDRLGGSLGSFAHPLYYFPPPERPFADDHLQAFEFDLVADGTDPDVIMNYGTNVMSFRAIPMTGQYGEYTGAIPFEIDEP